MKERAKIIFLRLLHRDSPMAYSRWGEREKNRGDWEREEKEPKQSLTGPNSATEIQSDDVNVSREKKKIKRDCTLRKEKGCASARLSSELL